MLVSICVHSICIILLLQHKYSAPLQHQHNWWHLPLPTSRRPSRANYGDPVLVPMVVLMFQRLLTSVRTTSVSPTPHPVHPSHPSHPASNQPAHKSQCFLIRSRRYDMIRSSQWYNMIQSTIWYDPASPLIRKTHPRPVLICLIASASLLYTTFSADVPSYDFSPSPAASASRHLLYSSTAEYSAVFFASDLDSAIPKANF